MAYPSLPPASFLNPIPSNQNPHSRSPNSGSASASSVEPITPEAQPNHPIPVSNTTTTTNMDSNAAAEDTIQCKWKGCDHVAPSPDQLYDHLCNVHVGRKSTNNLCLTCGWEGCGVKCVKRDHITSHLRGMSPFSFSPPPFLLTALWHPLLANPHSPPWVFGISACVGPFMTALHPLTFLGSPHTTQTSSMRRLWQDFQTSPRPEEA
jgi:hypothetical protein